MHCSKGCMHGRRQESCAATQRQKQPAISATQCDVPVPSADRKAAQSRSLPTGTHPDARRRLPALQHLQHFQVGGWVRGRGGAVAAGCRCRFSRLPHRRLRCRFSCCCRGGRWVVNQATCSQCRCDRQRRGVTAGCFLAACGARKVWRTSGSDSGQLDTLELVQAHLQASLYNAQIVQTQSTSWQTSPHTVGIYRRSGSRHAAGARACAVTCAARRAAAAGAAQQLRQQPLDLPQLALQLGAGASGRG